MSDLLVPRSVIYVPPEEAARRRAARAALFAELEEVCYGDEVKHATALTLLDAAAKGGLDVDDTLRGIIASTRAGNEIAAEIERTRGMTRSERRKADRDTRRYARKTGHRHKEAGATER